MAKRKPFWINRATMHENVIDLPVTRKAGRRRVQPVPGAQVAPVLQFDASCHAVETAEQRLATIEEALNRLATALLMASRVTRELCQLANLSGPLA